MVPAIVRGAGCAQVAGNSVRISGRPGASRLDRIDVDVSLRRLIPHRTYTLAIDVYGKGGARIAGSRRVLQAPSAEHVVRESFPGLDLWGAGIDWDVRCVSTIAAGAASVDGGKLTCVVNATALQDGERYECYLMRPAPPKGQMSTTRKQLAETTGAHDQQVTFQIESRQPVGPDGTVGIALALAGIEVGGLCQPSIDDADCAVAVPFSWGKGSGTVSSPNGRTALEWDDERHCAVLGYEVAVPENASALPVTVSVTPHIRNVDGTDITDTDQAASTTVEASLEPGETLRMLCPLSEGFLKASRGLRMVPIVRATTAVAVDYCESRLSEPDPQGGGRRGQVLRRQQG